MRVIAGQYRGRTLIAPKGDHTRPTSDRVRESMFSALASRLGAELGGGAVLDAFAGSGALGIEALSRGCATATFVESDRAALRTLKGNLESLDLQSRGRVLEGDVLSMASRCGIAGGPFSLLLLDPPYKLAWANIALLTSALARCELLIDGALIVYEHASDGPADWPTGFSLDTYKKYGTTGIDVVVYQGEAGPE